VLEVRVIERRVEAEDVLSFEVQRTDGGALPPYTAGAHIDVHLPDKLIRQYSLCGPHAKPHTYLIGVLKEPSSRGGSKALRERVQVGDTLLISEPRNKFPLDVHARRSLLFAGGIGITPILAMADELARDGRDFELHYCTRSRARMAFIERIASSPWAAKASLHFDDGAAEQRLDAARVLGGPADDTHIYVCGPSGFMNYVLGAGRTLGWEEARLHREYFVAEPVDHAADKPFELELRRSGRTVFVPADISAASALANAGVEIPLSCEQGVCGTCLTSVLEGIPDHRDFYLTAEEHQRNDRFTPCCSRSLTPRLLVDL
jgi:vanillate O-demethylase ferredoxin subunit